MNKNIYIFKEIIEKSSLKKALFSIIMLFILTANIQAQTANQGSVITDFPYLEEFTNGSPTLDEWTTFDVNGDGDNHPTYPNGKWTFSQNAAKYTFSNNNLPADDWLISPKVKISGNLAITFKHKVQQNNREEKFSVYIITGNSPKNLENANKILDTKKNTSNEYQTIEAISIPSTYNNQEVYIGIKCESDQNGMGLFIDDFKIAAQETGTFALTASVVNGVGGEITPSNISVNLGAEQVFIITPAENYTIDKLTDNNTTKTPVFNESNNTYSYTVSNISSEHIITVKFKLHNPSGTTYTLTATVNEDGNGSISPPNVTVEPGQGQIFDISPDEGYEIYKLMDSGDDKTTQVTTNNKYILTNITKNHEIIVSFKRKTYTLNASVEDPATGSITPTSISVTHGSDLDFKTTPAQGYTLESLMDNGNEKISDVNEEGKYLLSDVKEEHSIVAKFKLTGTPAQSYSLKASVVGGNGTIDPDTETFVQHGANQKFIIKPALGYEIESLTDNNDIKTEEIAEEQQYIIIDLNGNIQHIPNGTADVYNLNDIQGDHIILVKFKQEGTTPPPPSTTTFSLAANIFGGNGKITPPTSSVEAGDEKTFTITPDTGYELDYLLDNTENKTSDVTNGEYKLTNIQSNHTIVVKFKQNGTPNTTIFSLSASVDGIGGTITHPNTSVNMGADEEFTITPDSGYELESLVDNNESKTVDASGKYKLTNIQSNHTIVVKFKQNGTPNTTIFSLSASVDGIGGTITHPNTSVNMGADEEFTITPDSGYELESLVDNNESKTVNASGKYKLTNIQSNHTIVVKFKQNGTPNTTIFSLSASVDGIGGTITHQNTSVNMGADEEFTITPDSGYELESLVDNTEHKTVDANGKYKLTNIQANHTIVVKFKKSTKISEDSSIEINVYPNPTNDFLNIYSPNLISKILIITRDGKTIDSKNVNNYYYQYQTSKLAEGNYIILMYVDKKISQKQFSVIR